MLVESKRKRNSEMEDEAGGQFITIVENTQRARVEVHLKGMFPDPSRVTRELATLHSMAATYDYIAFFINSQGGSITTLTELMAIAKKYRVVFTINTGECSSAGFLMWAIGDVRVVSQYSIFMAHRESYIYAGKTENHFNMAKFNEEQYSRLVGEVFEGILTTEELTRARLTEVHLSDNEILGRRVGISWERFLERDNAIHTASSLVDIGGFMFVYDEATDSMTPVKSIELADPLRAVDVVYNSDFRVTEEEKDLDTAEIIPHTGLSKEEVLLLEDDAPVRQKRKRR